MAMHPTDQEDWDAAYRVRQILRYNVDLFGFTTTRVTAPKWIEFGPKAECWTNALDNLMASPNQQRYAYCEGYVLGEGIDGADEGRAHGFLIDRHKGAAVECTVADALARWGTHVEFHGIPFVTAEVIEFQALQREIAYADPGDLEPHFVMGVFETVVGMEMDEVSTQMLLNRMIDHDLLEALR